MRKLIPGLAVAALLAGGVVPPMLADAQTAPAAGAPAQVLPAQTPPPGPMRVPPSAGAWAHGPAPGWAPPWMARHAMHAAFAWRRTWGLFHRSADLALSPSDVQTIAEGLLLRNGEHDWKVGDVTANADHTVSFAFVTTHGDVIARFVMDTQNGRIRRTG